jgi:hypothetical protein
VSQICRGNDPQGDDGELTPLGAILFFPSLALTIWLITWFLEDGSGWGLLGAILSLPAVGLVIAGLLWLENKLYG